MDGTQNRNGKIQYGIDLLVMVGDHQERIHFLLGKTQSHMVILGHDWLKQHNPEIDWVKAEVKLTHCPSPCSSSPHHRLTPMRSPAPWPQPVFRTPVFPTLAPPPIGPASTHQSLVKPNGTSFPQSAQTLILRSSSRRTLGTSPPSYILCCKMRQWR